MKALLVLFIVKIPSLAGIGGLLAGLMNQRLSKALMIAAVLGALDGILLNMVMQVGTVSAESFVMGVIAAVVMASIAWFIRLKIRERNIGG